MRQKFRITKRPSRMVIDEFVWHIWIFSYKFRWFPFIFGKWEPLILGSFDSLEEAENRIRVSRDPMAYLEDGKVVVKEFKL